MNFLSSVTRVKLGVRKSTKRFVASAQALRKNLSCYHFIVIVIVRGSQSRDSVPLRKHCVRTPIFSVLLLLMFG